jgi:hypothetical protein
VKVPRTPFPDDYQVETGGERLSHSELKGFVLFESFSPKLFFPGRFEWIQALKRCIKPDRPGTCPRSFVSRIILPMPTFSATTAVNRAEGLPMSSRGSCTTVMGLKHESHRPVPQFACWGCRSQCGP